MMMPEQLSERYSMYVINTVIRHNHVVLISTRTAAHGTRLKEAQAAVTVPSSWHKSTIDKRTTASKIFLASFSLLLPNAASVLQTC